MKKFLLLSLCILLGACKLELTAPVKVSQLTSERQEKVSADIFVDVGVCEEKERNKTTDFSADRLEKTISKDAPNESNALKEIKQKIAYIFPTAVYHDCKAKMMESKAHFTLDIPLHHQASKDEIYFLNDAENFLSARIASTLRKRIADTKKDVGDDLEFELIAQIINDTSRSFKLMTGMTYIDDVPVITRVLTLKPTEKRKIRLSNVAVDVFLNPYQEKDAGTASFLWPMGD